MFRLEPRYYGRGMQGGYEKSRISTNIKAVLTVADQYMVCRTVRTALLSMTLNDPKPRLSRSRHYLTLNISETVRDRQSYTTSY